MSVLATVEQFRLWSGANTPSSVSDELIQQCLDEAEAAIATESGQTIPAIQGSLPALAIATGEELRRASRLLARRNSPEAVMGAGSEGLMITLPSRDPDSSAAVRQIRAILLTPEAVA